MARRSNPSKDSKKLKVFAGRYAYVKPLGRGAGGSVYLAEDLYHHRRQVALKVLTPEACATVQGKMLRREFEILSKLNHPNLVRVYDYGSLPDGGVFLAEEYIDGFSLQDARALLNPEALIDLTMQILNGLSYVHGMGMIHRDIKPANVMLLWLDDEVAEPQAKLVDFGLSSMDPKRDTLRGGTRSYMAPEIIRGEKGEPQSDLFSLGVTLYYALCGVLPFGPRAKDDPPPTEENFRPPDPHRLNPEVPLTLSRFTMALLRQIKGVEFEDAGEAMQALSREIEGDSGFSGGILANDMQVAAPQIIRGYFERGVILDQLRAQEDLVEQLTEEPRPTGSLFFLVAGEKQTGKSRLLHEISTSCKLQGRLVVKLEAQAQMKPWALLGQIVQCLWDLTRHRKSNPLEKYREDLSMLSRMSTLPIREEVLIRQQSRWLLNAFKDACTMLYDERLLLCLEDLHLADEASVSFLTRWLERADSFERVDIIATARPDERLTELVQCKRVQPVLNDGLKLEDVRYFIRERLGAFEIPDAWMEEVAQRAQGQPSYLEEVCRHLVDHGILRRDTATKWTVNLQELELFTLPMSLQESIRRRLGNISAAGREILELLTLSEQPLPWRMIRRLAVAGGESAENVDRAIEMLKWRHLVAINLDMSGRSIELIHPAVRDVIGGMLSPEWAKALHRRLGTQLLERWLKEGGQVDAVASHLFDGGQAERAMIITGQASDLKPSPELERRLAWFERMETQVKRPQERVLTSLSYATMCLRSLNPTRARQTLSQAAQDAEGLHSEWLMFQAYIQAAELDLAVDDIDGAQMWVVRVQDALPVLRVQPRSSTVFARLAMIRGELGQARRELHLAQKRQEILGDIKGLIDTISLLAEIDALCLDAESASQNLQAVYDLASEHQLTERLGRALLAHARLLCEEGAFERSLKLLADALDAMQGGKHPEIWIEILWETTAVALLANQQGLAERRAIETLVMARLLEHKSLEAAATVMVAAVAVVQAKGDPIEHLERMIVAHEHLTQANLYPQLCIRSALALSRTLAGVGRADEASAFEREAGALRQRLAQRR